MLRQVRPAVGALLAFALSLRLFHLGRQSIWMDEAFSIWMASHPIRDIVNLLKFDAHPPLFYSLLHFWMAGGASAGYLRIPEACLGAVNCLLVYFLGRSLAGNKIGLLSASFWSVSYLALDQETQVRMYSLATTLSLASTICFWRATTQNRTGQWLLYFAFSILCAYTHYYTAFILLGHLVYLGISKEFKKMAWIVALLVVAFLPWLPTFQVQFQNQISRLLPNISWSFLPEFLASMIGMNDFLISQQWIRIVIGLFAAVLVFLPLGKAREKKRSEISFLASVVGTSFLIPFLISQWTSHHIFIFRYVVLFAPYFFLLMFVGLFELSTRISVPVFTALLLANLGTWVLVLTGPAFERQNWLGVAGFLGKSLRPGDVVFLEQSMAIYPLWYYLPKSLDIEWKVNQKGLLLERTIYVGQRLNGRKSVVWVPLEGPDNFFTFRAPAEGSSRQWLVLCQELMVDPQRIVLGWFNRTRHRSQAVEFHSVRSGNEIYVFLFEKNI